MVWSRLRLGLVTLLLLPGLAEAQPPVRPGTPPAGPGAGPTVVPRPAAPPTAAPPAATPPAAVKPVPKKNDPPAAQDITLTTKDGVVLTATYYAGTKGKSAVPVLLLHGPKQQRTVMDPLARFIQLLGHAALAVDLRGHGGSVRRSDGTATLDAAKMRPADFQLVGEDFEAAKRFLVTENDAERLNIDLLGVVAAKEACASAVVWAVQDWSWAELPGRRQGRDVKGLVLLSPERQWGRTNVQSVITSPALTQMSTLIVVGEEDRSGLKEAHALQNSLEILLKRNGLDPAAPAGTLRPLFVAEVPGTSLTGSDLIDPRNSLRVEQTINSFIETQLASRAATAPWAKRAP